MNERWAPIPDMPDYDVSDRGNVRSWKSPSFPRALRPRLLKPWTHKRGYRYVRLSMDGKATSHKVHRLVLLAFIGPSDLEVRHLDGNPANNVLGNLLYGTRSENMFDMWRDRKRSR